MNFDTRVGVLAAAAAVPLIRAAVPLVPVPGPGPMPGQCEAVSQQSRAADWARRRWWRVFPGQGGQLDVIAVASELGANAVCHTASGRGGQFSVEVAWTGSVVSIVVGDGGGPAEPRVIDDPESENGRGLLLVRSLSLTVEVTGDKRGRFVRADVPWAE
jgi:anti-sigma regulatory factor (Ser/Thr protein kinase)